jgi:hypothetical protein
MSGLVLGKLPECLVRVVFEFLGGCLADVLNRFGIVSRVAYQTVRVSSECWPSLAFTNRVGAGYTATGLPFFESIRRLMYLRDSSKLFARVTCLVVPEPCFSLRHFLKVPLGLRNFGIATPDACCTLIMWEPVWHDWTMTLKTVRFADEGQMQVTVFLQPFQEDSVSTSTERFLLAAYTRDFSTLSHLEAPVGDSVLGNPSAGVHVGLVEEYKPLAILLRNKTVIEVGPRPWCQSTLNGQVPIVCFKPWSTVSFESATINCF